MATSPKENDAAGAAPKKKSKLPIIIVAAVLVVAAAGFAAMKLMGGSKPSAHTEDVAAVDTAPASVPVYVPIDPFVLNLQPDAGDYYIQIAMTLQVPNLQTADALKLFMPQVRSRLLLLVSSKKASELLTSDGKETLRDDIIDTLSEPFTGNRGLIINDVAFTSFVIQQQ